MTRFYRSDPLELRVLDALARGAATAAEVAAQVEAPEGSVGPILEHGVAEGLVSRLDLAGTPSYSLTATGVQAVGVYQGVAGAVDPSGHVDLGAAARMVMQEYDAAKDVATQRALEEQRGWPADDATRDRFSAALADAYGRGALTKEQLDERTTRALEATTMGELRAAGEGVVVLPPVVPEGGGATFVSQPTRLTVDPALLQVRWRRVGYAGALVMVGLFLLMVQPLLAVVVLVAAVLVGGRALLPLLKTGTTRVTTP